MTQLAHGRCSGDSHTPGEARDNERAGNNDRGDKVDNDNGSDCNNNNGNRDDPTVMLPIVTRHKWSDSLARKTADAQSKVFDTGRKKPGGTRTEVLRTERE